MAVLPKGITETRYQTKDGEVIKYRVRVKNKNITINKLFDRLDLAIECLNSTKTITGRNILNNALLGISEEEQKRKFIAERLTSERLKDHLTTYFNTFLKRLEETDKDIKNNKTYLYMIKSIENTQIEDTEEENNPFMSIVNSLPPNMKKMSKLGVKSFGEFNVLHITKREIFNYINARLAKVASSTVKRELAFLQGFFNRLDYFGKQYEGLTNPVAECDKSKLDTPFQKRDRRLSEEEEYRLYKALKDMRNPDMVYITALAHYTGARRSEILNMLWSGVNENFIYLNKTKNGWSRRVKIFKEAREVLDKIVKIEGNDRVFHYTPDGFKSNFKRALKSAKISNFSFRDLRSEFVSLLLEQNLESVVIAELAGISNQNYFDNTYMKNHEENQFLNSNSNNVTQEQLRNMVGHRTKKMQRHYYRSSEQALNKIQKLKK